MSKAAADNWKEVALGEHAHIKARIGWRGLSSNEYTESGAYLIAGTHIKGARIDWEKCDHIDDFRYEESPEIQLREHDVVISKDGTIGRLGYVENMPGPATINGTMMLIRPEKMFYSKFIYFYLQGDKFQKIIKEKISGSSVPHIFQRDMVTLLVPHPPLPEQQKIAAILSSVDDVIEKTRAQIDKLKDLKTGMMQELLSKGIGSDGVPHTEFKDSPVGRIPVAWTVKNLSELIHSMESGWSPQCESEPAKPGEWAVLKTTSVTWDGFDYTANKKLPNYLSPRTQIQVNEGDILITRAGPTERVGVVAYVDQVSDKIMLSDKLIRLKARENIDALYLTFYLSTDFTKDFLAKRMTGLAQSQTNISQEILKSIPCAVPPLSEQNLIGTSINEVNKRMRICLNRLQKQQNIKKALMQDLLTGKVRVNVGENETAVA